MDELSKMYFTQILEKTRNEHEFAEMIKEMIKENNNNQNK